MKRTVAVSLVFAATLGMAGMAQAQTAPGEVYGPAQRYESAGKPTAGQQAAPSVFTSPAVPSNSNPYWRTNTPGMTNPQQVPASPTSP
jgi:hypothetical protein